MVTTKGRKARRASLGIPKSVEGTDKVVSGNSAAGKSRGSQGNSSSSSKGSSPGANGTSGSSKAQASASPGSEKSGGKRRGKKGRRGSGVGKGDGGDGGMGGAESRASADVQAASTEAPKPVMGIAKFDADDFMSGGFMAGLEDHDDDDGDDAVSGNAVEMEADSDSEKDGSDPESDDSGDEDANASAMDLKGLAETDPEFFSFLQKEEPTLLDFDPDETDDSEEEDDGVEEEAAADGGVGASRATAALLRKASGRGGVTLTMPLLKAMRHEAFVRKSVKGVRRLIKAFHCACHLGDEAGQGNGGTGAQQKFRVPSSEVYNELMVSTLEGLHPAIMCLLFPDRSSTAAASTKRSAVGSGPAGDDSNASSVSLAATAGKEGESPGGGKKARAKKRRRDEENSTDRDKNLPRGKGSAEPDAAAGQGGKKKRRKGNGDGGGDGVSGSGKKNGEPAGNRMDTGEGEGRAEGEAREVAVGSHEERAVVSSLALVLTKEDFRVAALLPAWKALQPALYGFFKSLLHVLEELHDRALLAFLLSKLEHYVPFLVPFPGLARGLLKALLGLWGGAGAEAKGSGGGSEEDGEEAERVRLLAYLRVRQMASALPFPFVEGCMKGLYLAFAKRARAPPPSQAGKMSLRVMEGCVVELYGMDVSSAYQNAFLYIRQLSLLLRRAMQQKTKDSVQTVRRWQVVTCLRVWTGVLAAAPAEDELRMLIFPLAQVIEGIVHLSSTLRHSPLMFQLVRMRQRLAAAAELYVPCSTPLLEVLRSPALFKKATASTEAPPNVPTILRLGKTQVDEGRAQGAVVGEALRLLGQEMDLYRYSVAFPELVIPVLGHLRKFARATKVSKWRMMTRGLMETLETRGTWAAAKRLELRLDPSKVDGLEMLRPKGAPTMRERLGASEAEVERIDDDATTIAPIAASPKSKASAAKDEKRRASGEALKEDEEDDEDESADDTDDSEEPSPARRVSKRKGVSSAVPGGVGNGVETAGDITAPDLVEDLGAWSDDEWA